MVHQRAFFLSLALLLYLIVFSAQAAADARAEEPNSGGWETGASRRQQRRIARVNHGSFRGPRKHLLDPATELPFQPTDLPV